MHAMKAQRQSTSMPPLSLNLGARWRSLVNITLRPFYPMTWRLGGRQSWREIVWRWEYLRPGFELRSVQPTMLPRPRTPSCSHVKSKSSASPHTVFTWDLLKYKPYIYTSVFQMDSSPRDLRRKFYAHFKSLSRVPHAPPFHRPLLYYRNNTSWKVLIKKLITVFELIYASNKTRRWLYLVLSAKNAIRLKLNEAVRLQRV
jgi:hypothetical protein